MIPNVSEELRNMLRDALYGPISTRRGERSSLPSQLVPVAPDLARFGAQSSELRRRKLKHVAATFRDETDDSPVEVLLAPDLMDFDQSLDDLTRVMRQSGIPTEAVGEKRAEKIFIERVAEFLTAFSPGGGGSGGGGSTSGNTLVHTNRHGDSVVYCLGYFISTATAFGISTPASVRLKGRYSFGIIDNGVPRYDGVVWTCPATVQVKLP